MKKLQKYFLQNFIILIYSFVIAILYWKLTKSVPSLEVIAAMVAVFYVPKYIDEKKNQEKRRILIDLSMIINRLRSLIQKDNNLIDVNYLKQYVDARKQLFAAHNEILCSISLYFDDSFNNEIDKLLEIFRKIDVNLMHINSGITGQNRKECFKQIDKFKKDLYIKIENIDKIIKDIKNEI